LTAPVDTSVASRSRGTAGQWERFRVSVRAELLTVSSCHTGQSRRKAAKRGAKLGSVIDRAREAKPPAPTGRPKKGSQCLPLPKGSNSADRLTARIARDAPEVLERCESADFRPCRRLVDAGSRARVDCGGQSVLSSMNVKLCMKNKIPRQYACAPPKARHARAQRPQGGFIPA